MAILKGFPPSNTISPGPRIPLERERRVKITEVPIEARFSSGSAEFMMLPSGMNRKDPRAVCYKGNSHTTPGHIYGFNEDLEVTWFEEYFPKHEPPVLEVTFQERREPDHSGHTS